MIKVLLVDDHKIVRDGLKALLLTQPNIEIVGECEDGVQVIPFLDEHEVDIVLMDVQMKHANGIDTTKLVLEKYPKAKIIGLTMQNEESYISKMLKAGAAGYVLKSSGKEEIISAIESVHNGESYVGNDVTEIIMSKYLKKSKGSNKVHNFVSIEDLTKREIEILRLIAEEHTNNEIADKLFISPRTVETHRRNLIQKLGVKNTAGLVKIAIHNDLVE